MNKIALLRICLSIFILLPFTSAYSSDHLRKFHIQGKIMTPQKEAVEFVTVQLKGTKYGAITDEKGIYRLRAPKGNYTLVISAIGYETITKKIKLEDEQSLKLDFIIKPNETELNSVVVEASSVKRLKESAYNVVAIDAKNLHNTTTDIASSLAKLPGVKLRESGGVGSDMRISLDGFTGKHIKLFIDGVPQDGVGTAFSLNNIPINFADRIEVYRGVVPVSFGADAIGGVINVVTSKKRKTFVDASYSFGSFNTHKSYINTGHTTKKGLMFEINAFQNYSDNSYTMHTSVFDLEAGGADKDKIEKVKRFHSGFHNETIIGKIGLVNKTFADRLVFSINLSQYDKEIQNGVNQAIVYGRKKQNGHSIMPSLEYKKRHFIVNNLDVNLSINYNRNMRHNLDTATYIFNWRGESIYNGGKLGEQSYQNAKFDDDNWSGRFNASYRIGSAHSFTLNHVLTAFKRSTRGSSEAQSASSTYDKKTQKNITGLSYRFSHNDIWNISVFGKYYNQYNNGPRNQSTSGGYDFVLFSENLGKFGYGIAGTYYFLKDFQAKLSYEKAYRLPTNDELFGDEDLELGSANLKPETSDNFNVNLSYNKNIDKHSIYVEGSFLYRDTKDFIHRISNQKYTGGKYYASHENFGKVRTIGLSAETRYNYSNRLSIGGNITSQNIMEYERFEESGSQKERLTYKVRIPNIPYLFSNIDASIYFHNLLKKGNTLTITYNNMYVHQFPLEPEVLGDSSTKYGIPSQFSHDLGFTYRMNKGKINLGFECKNITNELLYDNYRLQKAGRAFYGKVRFYFQK